MITYDVSVFFGKNKPEKKATVKCHDTGVNLRIFFKKMKKLSEWRTEEKAYNIPQSSTAVLKISKPDKTKVLVDGTITAESAFFSLPPQAFTASGISEAEVSIYGEDGRRITSSTFFIDVPEECVNDSDPDAGDYVDIFAEQIKLATAAAERAETAEKDAEKDASEAKTSAAAAIKASEEAEGFSETAQNAAEHAGQAAEAATKASEDVEFFRKIAEEVAKILGAEADSIQLGEGAKAHSPYSVAIGPEAEAGNANDKTGSEGGISIGKRTKARKKRDVALGYECVTDAENGFSGGANCETTGKNAFSYGNQAKAKGTSSIAVNTGNEALASDSYAGGWFSQAHRWMSFAHGLFLRAYRQAQAVFGEYNAYNTKALFIIGNGTSEQDRKNAFMVMEDGSATVQKSLKAPTLEATTVMVTGTPANPTDGTNKDYVDRLVGDISAALTELHTYAQNIAGGADA